jgi:hypothetical protein
MNPEARVSKLDLILCFYFYFYFYFVRFTHLNFINK